MGGGRAACAAALCQPGSVEPRNAWPGIACHTARDAPPRQARAVPTTCLGSLVEFRRRPSVRRAHLRSRPGVGARSRRHAGAIPCAIWSGLRTDCAGAPARGKDLSGRVPGAGRATTRFPRVGGGKFYGGLRRVVAGRFHRRARPQSTGPGAIQPRPAPRRHRGVQPESRDHLRILDRALQLGAWLPDSGEPGHGTDSGAREGTPASLQRRPNTSVLRPTVSTASRAWTRAGVRGRGDSGICRTRTSCGGAVVPAAPRMGRRAEGGRGRRCSRHPRSDGPPSRDRNRRGLALVLGAVGRPHRAQSANSRTRFGHWRRRCSGPGRTTNAST